MNTWVYIDHFKGAALPASWEALGAAKSLGGSVTALVLGSGVDELTKSAFEFGADAAFVAEDASLADFRAEVFASTLASISDSPDAILLPNTTRGRELAAMLAIDLKSGVLVDVIALELSDGQLTVTRPIFSGKLLAKETCSVRPQILTLRGRAFPRPARQLGRTSPVTRLTAKAEGLTTIEGYSAAEGGVSLADASVIVSTGRGIAFNPALTPPAGLDDKQAEAWRAQQGLNLVKELADLLGSAVGASRAAVDAGYLSYPHQVGQTGKVVSPDLYIALGISGAIQHQAGMRTSKVIVAINKDAEAPIFQIARYGVVGDLHQIVPALTAAFKKKLGK